MLAPVAAETAIPPGTHRGRLFRKYLLLILTLVTGALLASGAHQRLLFVPGEPLGAGEPAAREGRRRGIADRAIHPADRPAARLRCVAPARCRRHRVAPHRVPEAPAPGAGSHRYRAARRQWPRADRRFAPRDGRPRLRQGPVAGAGVSQCEARQAVVRTRVLPQGNRAVHDDRHPLRRRQRTGDDRRGEPQVHLGRRIADQDRRQGKGLRRRRQRLSHRGSGYRAGASQDQPVESRARQGDRGDP